MPNKYGTIAEPVTAFPEKKRILRRKGEKRGQKWLKTTIFDKKRLLYQVLLGILRKNDIKSHKKDIKKL